MVVDASALLAYLQDEDGADAVADAIAGQVSISTVNLAEVFSLAAGHGADPQQLATDLIDRGLLGAAIAVEPFTTEDAIAVGRMRPITRHLGLSLADRACLALAQRLNVSALSADSIWERADVGVVVRLIR